MISTWPLWIGSNEPGYRTLVMRSPYRCDPVRLTNSQVSGVRRRCAARSPRGCGRSAWPAPPPTRTAGRRPSGASSTAVRGGQVEQQLGPAVVVVRRVEQREVPAPLLAGARRGTARPAPPPPRRPPPARRPPGSPRWRGGPRCPGRRRWRGRRPARAPRCPWPRSRRRGRGRSPPARRRGCPSALNVASRTRSGVGRVAGPSGATSLRPRADPEITLIAGDGSEDATVPLRSPR